MVLRKLKIVQNVITYISAVNTDNIIILNFIDWKYLDAIKRNLTALLQAIASRQYLYEEHHTRTRVRYEHVPEVGARTWLNVSNSVNPYCPFANHSFPPLTVGKEVSYELGLSGRNALAQMIWNYVPSSKTSTKDYYSFFV